MKISVSWESEEGGDCYNVLTDMIYKVSIKDCYLMWQRFSVTR